MTLEETLRRIVPADRSIEEEAWRRWDSIAKPLRGLGLLEEAIARIAGMARTGEVGGVCLAGEEKRGGGKVLSNQSKPSCWGN